MFKLDFSVRRVYIASFAAIAYLLAHRGIISHDWPATRTLGAIASDAIILAALFFVYALLDRWLQPESLAARGHKALHFALTLTVIAIATGAQVLYEKTGEILDFGIVTFFLGNFGDLKGASQSVIDQDVLLMFISCFGFYLLSLLRMRTPLLRFLRYALFLSPIVLVGFDFVYEYTDTDDFTVPISERALYTGKYANLTGTQQQWLAREQAAWRDGILSSLSASATQGISQFRHLEERATPLPIYTPPSRLNSARITPNILFILLESTRADIVGAYEGNSTAASNTPFIDSLAADGLLFERAYTTVPHTSKALVGIYCGTFAKFGTESFESTEGHYPITCLPKLLSPLGYRTAHFQTAPGTFEDRSRFLINAGFEHTVVQEDLNPDQHEKFGYLGLDDRLLVTPMLEWMKKQKRDKRPFFASILTVMTHHPYVSPAYREPLQNPAQGKNAYLSAVRYTDDIVRELVEGMRQSGLLDNTIVVVTGDHGEGFAEHGQIAHNGTAYEEGMRVPLIVYAPWRFPNAKRISGLRQHIDLMPSIIELMGSTHDGKLPGTSLFDDPAGHDDLLTSCFYDDYCLNHYEKNGTKLIYFFGKRPTELFDLNVDPKERINLSPKHEAEGIAVRIERLATLRKSYNRVYSD